MKERIILSLEAVGDGCVTNKDTTVPRSQAIGWTSKSRKTFLLILKREKNVSEVYKKQKNEE